jgi:hypothetical protein
MQHHVVALGEREHQLRPSVVDARFSLVLQIPRVDARRELTEVSIIYAR